MEAADEPLRLLTHVLISDAALSMGTGNVVEPVSLNDQITLGVNVPMQRHYLAGTLVHSGLAQRLADAGFEDAIVELGQPVVPVALDGDDDENPYWADETFTVEAYSVPVVEPSEEPFEEDV